MELIKTPCVNKTHLEAKLLKQHSDFILNINEQQATLFDLVSNAIPVRATR